MTCKNAFKTAYASAPQYSSGRRRLREVKDRINEQASTLRAIEAIVKGERDCHPNELLGVCVAFERADWLRGLPEEIAALMGREILPAIGALVHDGISDRLAKEQLVMARARTDDLIHRCELVRKKLLLTVKDEYDAMRAGDSMLRRLLDEAFDIAETALLPVKCAEMQE